METLLQEKCTPFSVYSFPVSQSEIKELKRQVPNWQIERRFKKRQLVRTYNVPNFKQALAFAQELGEVAESQGHSPILVVQVNTVKVVWWTSSIRGLHRNDFIMAALTDLVFKRKFINNR